MSTDTRHIKSPSDDAWVWVLGGAVLVIAGLFYAVIQVGHVATGDGWLPGGANPIDVGKWWFTHGREWTIPHTVLAVLLGLGLIAGMVWWMDRSTQKSAQAKSIDGRAKYLGVGKVMHAKVVQADAVESKLTDDPAFFGFHVARTLPKNLSNMPSKKQVTEAPYEVPKGSTELWCGYRDSACAIMGTGSGKTTAMIIPLAVEAPGAVWTTSNRPDVVAGLLGPRSAVGTVWVFDPQGVADMPATWFWNPLTYLAPDGPVTSEVKSRMLAKQFAEAGRPLDAKTDAFFEPEGQEALANLLLACYVADKPITQVMVWARNPDDEEPLDILKAAGWNLPADSLGGVYEMNPETRDSVLGTARSMIRFLSNKGAVHWVEQQGPDDDRPQFDPAAFVRSDADTMICLSREGSGSFGPIVAALTVAMAEAAESFAKTCKGGRLRKPLALLLDEVANVCRIKDLPDWYSHFGGRGIFVLSILQSLAQGEAAWGKTGMEKLWGATVVRMVGRGIGDTNFAESISKMCGNLDVRRGTRTSSKGRGGGSRSRSDNWTRERKLDIEHITELPKWRVILLPAGEQPVLGQLIPFWRRSEQMHAAVVASQEEFEAAHVVPVPVTV